MLVNACNYGCSGVDWITSTMDELSVDKIIYHIPLSTGLVPDYVEEIKTFINKKIKVDGIILDCTGEAPEVARFRELILLLTNAGYEEKQILCIDSSIDFSNELNNVVLPNWIDSCRHIPESQVIEPIQNRNILFLVLARLPKIHRVQLIIQLLELGLENQSLISCGSGDECNDHSIFDRIVPPSWRNKFPMLLDEGIVDRQVGSTMINSVFKRCMINVVIESCFENNLYGANGPEGTHSWNRLFYTEKTDKCFHLGQLPVFLAKKGYVGYLKNIYGFDVFDDVIDHSYDMIDDPNIRIISVANECKRLSGLGLDYFKSLPNLTDRLMYNKNQTSIVKHRLLSDSKIEFNKWIKGL